MYKTPSIYNHKWFDQFSKLAILQLSCRYLSHVSIFRKKIGVIIVTPNHMVHPPMDTHTHTHKNDIKYHNFF